VTTNHIGASIAIWRAKNIFPMCVKILLEIRGSTSTFWYRCIITICFGKKNFASESI